MSWIKITLPRSHFKGVTERFRQNASDRTLYQNCCDDDDARLVQFKSDGALLLHRARRALFNSSALLLHRARRALFNSSALYSK